jgi:hypothetical protein
MMYHSFTNENLFGVGVDMTDIRRFQKLTAETAERLAKKILTEYELQQYQNAAIQSSIWQLLIVRKRRFQNRSEPDFANSGLQISKSEKANLISRMYIYRKISSFVSFTSIQFLN